jgi:hypothetical protein
MMPYFRRFFCHTSPFSFFARVFALFQQGRFLRAFSHAAAEPLHFAASFRPPRQLFAFAISFSLIIFIDYYFMPLLFR